VLSTNQEFLYDSHRPVRVEGDVLEAQEVAEYGAAVYGQQ
jgi:hypothetical protein